MVERRTYAVGAAAIVLVAAGIAVVVIGPGDLFLPEESTTVNETAPQSDDATVLKRGTFEGKAGHDVSGTVLLMRDEDGLFLRFENYQQQQGPDVFVYVTPEGSPTTSSEIGAGTKVRIDGGADGGESTKVGNFTQRLPEDVTAEQINGVGIWCEQFATPFGAATLTADGNATSSG